MDIGIKSTRLLFWGILTALSAAFGTVRAQTDVIPSSADIRLVQGNAADQLLVQMKIHSTAGFGGILSALTLTIRYDASAGMALGGGSSFCNAWSPFTPSPVALDGGLAYRTYNGFGINRLEDAVFDGGCGVTLVPEQWFTITTIPVSGDGCTDFILGNNAFTQQANRDFYVSMGGHDVTGQVLASTVEAGNCATDCLGVPGGTALPGTSCDDQDPNTSSDTWGTDCICTGTSDCVPPGITGTNTNSPVCSTSALDLAVTATGTGPFTYAWTGVGTYSPSATSASVSVTGAATGAYQVTVSNACGDASASVSVEVDQAPSATINYAGSPYCAASGTATVTTNGGVGGTYTASPSGLSINENNGTINLGSSVAGTYTVTYSFAAGGSCSTFNTTASVTITAGPAATITYAGSPYCAASGTATVTQNGSVGGTYTASPSGLSINGNNGTINLGNSTAGTFTVTYTIAAGGGCAAFNSTAQVVLSAPSTWYADTDNDGVGDDANTVQACSQPTGYVAVGGDLCPADPAKISPGTCGCGIPDTDTDQDGLADCIDSCPTLAGEVGGPCDDGDPTTVNDVITTECVCEGTITIGIAEPGQARGTIVSLYPNPHVSGMIHVDIDGLSAANGQVLIAIHDVSGRLVHQGSIMAVGGKAHIAMDLSKETARGWYMVEVITNDHRYLKRLVMQ